jgi:hypothetical protein
MIRRIVAGSFVLAVSAVAALAQDDVVRLKSGEFILGKIQSSDDRGLTLERWDGSGVITIAWELIPETHHSRFRSEVTGASAAEAMLDGVRVITSFRVVEGLMLEEDTAANLYRVKTKESPQPTLIPKHVVLAVEKIKVAESQVYTPEERLQRYMAAVDMADLEQVAKAADFALSLGFPDQALQFYRSARNLIEARIREVEASTLSEDEKNAKYEEINELLKEFDRKVKEIEGAASLKEIEDHAASGDFDDAIRKAGEWVREYEGTKLWERNQDLVERLTREREEFVANRAKVLSRKVVEEFPKIVGKRIRELARADGVDAALKQAERLDDAIVADLASKFKATGEEVKHWWRQALAEREKKKSRANMGTGSWIVNGGQDGGYDSQQAPRQQPRGGGGGGGGQIPGMGGQGGSLEDLRRRYGGGGGGNQPGQQGQGQQQDLRKRLQTKDEWWKSQSSSVRESFLEANWALQSKLVQLGETKEKNCPQCYGQGTLKAQRAGTYVDVICQRCHNAKSEVEIVWW